MYGDGIKGTYRLNKTGELLQDLSVPIDAILASCNSTCMCSHWQSINNYYNSIINILATAAAYCIPLAREGTYKAYWSEELSSLKEASIEAHKLWISAGRPNIGLINDLRKEAKYKYKIAIRRAEKCTSLDLDDELSELFLNKDINKFWRKWNNRFHSYSSSSVINGCTDDVHVAEMFSNSFGSVYFDSYEDGSGYSECLERVQQAITHEQGCVNLFDVQDVEAALNRLKNGKACGIDDISKEHIVYAHPALIIHLKLLFNLIYNHGFVPDNFGKGITFPIIKDKCGDVSNSDNYRPVTISPVVSKIFEYCLLNKFSDYLQSNDLQFGFKPNSSCAHAIFLLSQVTDYFITHGSNVFMAALDASKAFDRVNHVKLFNILLDRGLPGKFVRLIIDWYGKSFSVVKWNDSTSSLVCVKSGIRQGGILSPIFFNLYADIMLNALRSSDLGCHLGKFYVGFIAYADDIILLSASVSDLQAMIDICYNKGSELDILFNVSKSCLFKIGKVAKETLGPLQLGLLPIVWVEKLKYLGVQFNSDKVLKADLSIFIRKFYASANAIFSHASNVNEFVKLHLIESFAFPVLSYASEALILSTRQLRDLSVCWNNIFRKIFHMNMWESVKVIQFYCNRLDFVRLVHLSKLKFVIALKKHVNNAVVALSHSVLMFPEFANYLQVYGLKVNYTLSEARNNIWDNFTSACLSS